MEVISPMPLWNCTPSRNAKSPNSRLGSSVNSVASIGSVTAVPVSSNLELNRVSVWPDI